MKKFFVVIFTLLALVVTDKAMAMPPLHEAIDSGSINQVIAELGKGIDVNERNSKGETALIFAVSKGQIDIVKILLDKGADVNAKTTGGDLPKATALVYAAANGNVDMVELLLDRGADIEATFTNKAGTITGTPIVAAAFSGNPYLIKVLVNRGANIEKAIGSWHNYRTKTQDPKLISTIDGAIALLEKSAQERKNAKESSMSTVHSKKEITEINNPSFGAAEKLMGDNDLAVVIGIEGYQNLPKSDYSYDDAAIVKEYLKALGFKERNIEFITDERATRSSIEKSIENWLPNKAKNDSKVFVYYSGHGAPDPSTGEAYLVPYDGDPNYLSVTGYPLKRLYESLGKLQAKEIVVALDSCFSGAGGRSVLAKGARPLVMMTTSTVLPSNIAVLSATQGTQISTSSSEKGHGVFTYYFLKALKDGKKDIAEIYSYIKPLVEDDAKQLNVQQSPSVSPDVEKLKGRFELRR